MKFNIFKDIQKFNIFLITFALTSNAYANSYTSTFLNIGNAEKIAILILIIVLIVIPSKYRIIAIGTILGLTMAYCTYKYLIPLLF